MYKLYEEAITNVREKVSKHDMGVEVFNDFINICTSSLVGWTK